MFELVCVHCSKVIHKMIVIPRGSKLLKFLSKHGSSMQHICHWCLNVITKGRATAQIFPMREMSPAPFLIFVLRSITLSLCSFCSYGVGFGDGKIIGRQYDLGHFLHQWSLVSCQDTWWMALRQNVEVMGSSTAFQPQSRGTICLAGSSCQSSSRADW